MKLIILLFLLMLIACGKDIPEISKIYSEWEIYDTIEGSVYFSINSLTKNMRNEIYLSAFVRKDWVGNDSYKFLKFSPDGLSEIDTTSFFNGFSVFNCVGKKIWKNSELFFIKYNETGTYCTVSDVTNKLRSSTQQIDFKGNIWLALEDYYYSPSDGIQMFDGEKWNIFFEGTDFWAICFDKLGNLYATTLPDLDEPGIVMKYNYNKWDTVLICSGAAKWIPCMHFDNENNLWCGVLSRWSVGQESGDGLYKYDGKNVTNYNIYNSKLPSNSVIDISIDKHNNKWIAMYAGGITKLENDGTWKNFDADNTPMRYSDAEHVLVDDNDNVWFTNYLGLIKFKE